MPDEPDRAPGGADADAPGARAEGTEPEGPSGFTQELPDVEEEHALDDADGGDREATAAAPDVVAPSAGAGGREPLAVLEDVTKRYGDVQALGPLSLTVDGDRVGLLGPNGAGKTTLIRLLLGLLGPSSGTVRVLGEEVDASTRRRIGYAPEGEALFPGLRGVEAVAYAGRLSGMPRADALQRAHQVLDYVDLGEARYRLVSRYSTGMRQRLKMAQALVHDPELLILDEPTEGVDPEARRDLLALIDELSRTHGIRLLLSTHLLHDVERLATHALVLNGGQVAAHGSLAELKTARARGFVVRVNGPPAALAARLEAAGVPYEAGTGVLRVHIDDPAPILAHARDAGLVVRHVAPLEMSLHEAFEQAVGGGARA